MLIVVTVVVVVVILVLVVVAVVMVVMVVVEVEVGLVMVMMMHRRREVAMSLIILERLGLAVVLVPRGILQASVLVVGRNRLAMGLLRIKVCVLGIRREIGRPSFPPLLEGLVDDPLGGHGE